MALDPVANFHLKNGAMIGRLNWLSDLSVTRVEQSFGMTTNYWYQLEWKEANRDKYTANGNITASEQFLQLVKRVPSQGE